MPREPRLGASGSFQVMHRIERSPALDGVAEPGSDLVRRAMVAEQAPCAESNQQGQWNPEPPTPLDWALGKDFQSDGHQAQDCKCGNEHEPIVRHHSQTGHAQNVHQAGHVQTPTEGED
jgi:hypothetical protein